ncbi:ATP-dependent DNA helicase RecG [Parasaccharibacter sp. TMW2.1882]|uniref:ATP-dependent DNA helicase RecG n=1 Tax=unclassified Parasaccharibacter TaxID=2626400 RepID=UPI00200A47FC|nr:MULTISPECIES: ATP-dependent DNA helicase RecG [unclassified Parasaccharibacter]MCK8636601.1 ATP-dependent DNA helicase RecG [Parasaccharibacter sp. TMW2.1885]MCL1496356.1 ATP-dependent DNA helicase RecG [Parasaccharibacter sp. TMW2.1882]
MPLAPPSARIAPLLAPISSLPGTGPRHATMLGRISGGRRIIDLLFTLPEKLIDRRRLMSVAEGRKLPAGDILTSRVRVTGIRRPVRSSQPTILTTRDSTGTLEITFFQKGRLFLPPEGAEILVSGKVGHYHDRLTLSRPDHIMAWEKKDRFPWLEPVWPLTAGLFPSTVRKAMQAALALIPPDLPEWLDPPLVKKRNWPSFATALGLMHFPKTLPSDDDPTPILERARARLAADEVLADQLCLGLARMQARTRTGRPLAGDGSLRRTLLERFGHEPTPAQRRVMAEIAADMERPTPMMRLLQGDVGAGKTLVALTAMLQAVEAGTQAAFMAPTEILAQQHASTCEALCPVPFVFLSGSVKGKARRVALAKLADGHAKIAIGTHALFQDGVTFADLGLAVIDEQHRFGVEQRMKLASKGAATDLLVMTATPIPRTLQLTEWGEMGVSRLDSKPAGRQPIHTTVHNMGKLDDIFAGMKRALDQGKQIFWVCPLIEESETQSAAAAEERWAELTKRFGPIIGLAHGRQDIDTRQNALTAFQKGQTRLLVATTVIEVGVDIPNATIMVIEQAERFGLAQLHQLRGRVGRGAQKSFCLLLHSEGTSFTAQRRLHLLRDTEDGFLIADEDFRIRGGGDLTGNRQSGLPGFRLADPTRLSLLLTAMRQDSQRELTRNPDLTGPRGEALQDLLHLFDRAIPDRLLVSG